MSKIEIKTKVSRVIFSSGANLETLNADHIVYGKTSITAIVETQNLADARAKVKHYIKNEKHGVAEIIIVSPPDVEDVVGFSAFVSGMFAERGINILTTLGSSTDDVFVIDGKDLTKALEILEVFK